MDSKDKIIADLLVENERIKKTSKKRFEENKKLKEKLSWLKEVNSRADNIVSHLNEIGYGNLANQSRGRFDWFAFTCIKYLEDLNKTIQKPRVDGIYNLTVDGERHLNAKVFHNICWIVKLKGKEPIQLHFLKDAKDFMLVAMIND